MKWLTNLFRRWYRGPVYDWKDLPRVPAREFVLGCMLRSNLMRTHATKTYPCRVIKAPFEDTGEDGVRADKIAGVLRERRYAVTTRLRHDGTCETELEFA